MTEDPTGLAPGLLTTINIVVVVAFQIWSRLNGNKKTSEKAKEVIANTADPSQVTKVDEKVVALQIDLKEIREELANFKTQSAVLIGKVLERSDSHDRSLTNVKRNNERLLTRAGIAWEDDVTIIPAKTTE